MPKFRYEEVRAHIRKTIMTKYEPGDRLPTLKSLSKMYRVSRNTIQRAIEDLTEEKLLWKRRGSGIFVADPKDRPLRIGFLYPWTVRQLHAYQWHNDLIVHVESEVARLGHELIVSCNIGKDIDSDVTPNVSRQIKSLDGILFFNMYNNNIIDEAISLGIPSILLHHVTFVHNVDRIEADNAGGTRLATKHLIELGHRRIGFITSRWRPGGQHHQLFWDREWGWREAMREAGLDCDQSLILETPREDWDEECVAEFKRMVFGPDPVTAFICINDITASYLYKVVHNMRLRIPDDLSIVGCENTPLSDLLSPRITSIDIPQENIARCAVSKLIQRIYGGQSDEILTVFRTKLVMKESTAAPLPEVQTRRVELAAELVEKPEIRSHQPLPSQPGIALQ